MPRFRYHQAREGTPWWHTAWQRQLGLWFLRCCPMKVTNPGSLTGWAHLSARGRRRPNRTSGEREAMTESDKQREGGDGRIRQAEQAGLTDRVDPPVSEREATAKSDKRSRPDREGGGGPRLGWKIGEEAGPKPFLGLKSNRVKENQF
jgi:hypothetical protein